MPTRLLLLSLDGIFLTVVVSILTIGHDFSKGPMKAGVRKSMIYFFYHICCKTYLFVCGLYTHSKKVESDYTYYLGPEYKDHMKKIKKTSTIISNHISWIDPIVLIKNLRPAFSPTSELQNVPLLATLIDVLDSIYIPRGGDEETKAQALKKIA
mmetsp:Transcript_8630/g.14600  ORF Transcript_8630/g.14600 Transcript_8630/m.14600 type:complete len:154 (+) Transcript_8630:227-688(+)